MEEIHGTDSWKRFMEQTHGTGSHRIKKYKKPFHVEKREETFRRAREEDPSP